VCLNAQYTRKKTSVSGQKTKTKHAKSLVASVSCSVRDLSSPRVDQSTRCPICKLSSPCVGTPRWGVSASCPVTNRQPFNGQFQDNLGTPASQRLNRTMGWHWHQLDHIQIISTSFQTRLTTPAPYHLFYRLDALPYAQPTVSKNWRLLSWIFSIQQFSQDE